MKNKYEEFKNYISSKSKISFEELSDLFLKFGDLDTMDFIEKYVNETNEFEKFDIYFKNFSNNEIDELNTTINKENDIVPTDTVKDYLKLINR